MKKKLCFIITKSEVGGAQKWVKDQINILNNTYDFYLVSNEEGWLNKDICIKERLLDKRIESLTSVLFFYKLYKFISKNNIDLIISNSANAGLYSRLLKVFFKIKIIYVSHGWSALYKNKKLIFLFKKIEKLLSFLTDSILCISNSDYEKAKFEIGINKKKLVVIENKIFSKNRKKRIKKDEGINILSVSRLAPPKRLDLLIKSVKSMKCQLYIVGDGCEKSKLEKICFENSIKNVKFLGEKKDFHDFNNYDIFALISDSEGLPMSAIEAMSFGLPLLLSDVGGCKELILNNGELVENEVTEIKKKIITIIKKREIMSNNSIKLFDSRFNLENFKEEYINYYNNILKS